MALAFLDERASSLPRLLSPGGLVCLAALTDGTTLPSGILCEYLNIVGPG